MGGVAGQRTATGRRMANDGAGQQQRPPNRGQLPPGAGRVQAGPDDKYGLLGLLSVIRMTNQDLNHLVLGQDLTSLGLNLNSTECLYATFGSPWGGSELAATIEPDYVLPSCYYQQPSTFKQAHLSKYSMKTLFYMFCQMPRDALQVHAAKELYKRGWRYHSQLRQWFTQEAGAYYVFDTQAWERVPYPERVDPRQLLANFLDEKALDEALAAAGEK
jgi:CCR4-NOT transcription complex subunit 2